MRASLGFTVWTIVVFSCFFEISKAQCDKSCDNNVRVTTTTTTITAENCSLSNAGSSENSTLLDLQPGTVYRVFANCSLFNCCLNAITRPEKITNLKADSTTSFLVLKWTKPPGNVSYYKVKWTGGGQTRSRNTTNTLQHIPNLTSGTEYKISVTAVAVDGETEGSEVTIYQYTIPTKPVNITANYRGTYSLNISWSLPKGNVNHYVVQLDRDINQTEASWLLFTGLSPGRPYTVSVTAVAGHLNNTSKLSVFATYPLPPESIRVLNRTNSSLTLTWGIDQQMLGAPNINYSIAYEGGDFDPITSTVNSTKLTSLNPGTQYEIQVTAVGPENLRSTGVNISTCTNPNPVLDLTAYPDTNMSVKVEWSFPQDNKNYSYNISTYNANGSAVNSQKVHSSSTFVTGLNPGTRYKFIVTTLFTSECFSTDKEVSIYTKPNPVANLQYNLLNPTTVNLIWDNFINYEPACTYLVQAKQGLNVAHNDSTTAQNYTFTGLTPGELYTLTVVAEVEEVQSEMEAITVQMIPNPPRNIQVTSQTEHSLTFTWDAPEDMQPDQYYFNVTTHTGPEETRNLSLTLDKLDSGSQYNITIVTVGANECKSQEVKQQAYTRPYSVTGLRQTEITPDSVTLVWNQTERKSDYTYSVAVSRFLNFTNVTSFTQQGLDSGTNYSFTVTARAADDTAAAPVTVSYFTRPYSIKDLVADTINTTSIKLEWKKPVQHKPEYRYLVKTAGCANLTNPSIPEESVEISGLTPGTSCSFCVTVMAENVLEGESNCTSQYTMPEKAQPLVSNKGSNSSLWVSWEKPPGNVEFYIVYVNHTDTNGTSERLNSSHRNYTLVNLPAGRLYTVVLATQSGPKPFTALSESVLNATFPNSPGAINILSQSTDSIHIGWEEAPLMMGAQFYYHLEIPRVQVKNTTLTNYTFDQLVSGTSYNISVRTVAAMGYKSEAIWRHMVTTRPFGVRALQADPSEETINLSWSNPEGYQSSYRYLLSLLDSNGNILWNETTKTRSYSFSKLDPGTSYRFNVTTETSDGTQGAPVDTSKCTNASPVEFLSCLAPNEKNASITWSWNTPKGHFSNFTVKLDDSQEEVQKGINFSRSNLMHFTNYTVGVTTQSCGESSNIVRKMCQTGITNPPIPMNYQSMISLDDVKCNMFTIKIDRDMLNAVHGPIKYVGVLVTEEDNSVDTTKMAQYLENHYEDNKDEPYLATIIPVADSDVKRRRSTLDPLSITVGDETKWNYYYNGLLKPTGNYIYAIVLFTDLKMKPKLINGQASLFSVTKFDNFARLPQDPVVIGLAAGLTLAIFCILLLVLIIFIIYWRRLSNKQSSAHRNSMRAKVRSAPVRVEDYEVYYKKQKADSNCGFAAEYEEVKVVGTQQSKNNALNPENKSKNRYNNVLPYDSSRVKLSIINGNPLDDYINANYIPGYNSKKEFIAAQGPLPITVSDFWRMIWEKNVHTIVMLTRCNEQGRVKCEQYWTPGTKHYGNITVTTTSEIPLDDWTIRDFDIKNVKTAETRSVRHFHFTAWPDHGVPETTELLISFRHLVREHMDQYRHSPTVVHCSAGVGRTGTFIAIDRLIFQIERENVVDIYGIVYDMRMHRTLMVQTEDQYVFLNQCALDIIRSRTGTNVDLIYQNTTALSIYENIELQNR